MNGRTLWCRLCTRQKGSYGFAYLDLSSGRFLINEVSHLDDLLALLQRLNPAEILYAEEQDWPDSVINRKGVRRRPVWEFELSNAKRLLTQQFGTRDLQSFGVEQSAGGANGRGLFNGLCQRYPARSVTAYPLYSP